MVSMLKKNENKKTFLLAHADAMFNESLMGLCSFVFVFKNSSSPFLMKKTKTKIRR